MCMRMGCTPVCATEVTDGVSAPTTDQFIEKGLRIIICVRTRKMVNYDWGGQPQGEL